MQTSIYNTTSILCNDLIWLIVHVARVKIVLFLVEYDNPPFLHLSVFTHGVVYKVLAYSHRFTAVSIIGCLLIIE